MQFNRRNFIRSASVLAALTINEMQALAAKKEIAAGSKTIEPGDETYWRNVRQLFPLSKDWTYLNNGTFGPSPFPVIEAVHNGMMDQDRDGNYGGYESTPGRLAKF